MRFARLVAFLFAFALTITAIPSSAAQQTKDMPPAPVPTPIFTAKKVFISNVSADFPVPASTPEVTYNEFYAAMKGWGRYELVSAPSDADLIFEISFDMHAGVPVIRLLLVDPKTRVVLWPIVEQVKIWALASTGRKNFDQAMAVLVDDLKTLVTPPPATTDNQKN
jgi:hypothetical protein